MATDNEAPATNSLSEPRWVIVGGGVAGGALAAVLARAGEPVLVLERDAKRTERVRGEYLVPWGVAELQRLRLLDTLLQAGAHWTRRQIPYGDVTRPDAAERMARDLGKVLLGVPGALCLGHTAICEAFLDAATGAGAQVLRGAKVRNVAPGTPPTITFEHGGHTRTLRPRTVIGADGRGSNLAKMLGFQVHADPPHHLLGGLIVDNAEGWPEGDQTIGLFGNHVLYVFPQGNGRVRLYAGTAYENRRSWSGADSIAKFLEHFRHNSLPNGNALAASRPIGPLQAYPNHDCWIEEPLAPGVLLIGDAAGHNDPSLGQGLAIALRDVRIVSELLLGSPHGRQLTDYTLERAERLSRLRLAGRVLARARYEFDDQARRRGARLFAACASDPSLGALLGMLLTGPEQAPQETFVQARWDELLAD